MPNVRIKHLVTRSSRLCMLLGPRSFSLCCLSTKRRRRGRACLSSLRECRSILFGRAWAQNRVPISGSAYAYGYGTLGEFVAWIIGWDLILEYAFGAATVAVGWSGYVVSLCQTLGINFPLTLSKGPFDPPIQAADGTMVQGILN